MLTDWKFHLKTKKIEQEIRKIRAVFYCLYKQMDGYNLAFRKMKAN